MQRPLSPLDLAVRLALLALVLGAVGASAQLVTPKTIPVFQDEQFNLAPSSRPGLGSAFIALDDTLADPGTTQGYYIGIGAARHAGPASFFVDLVVQPMTSETWAGIARDIPPTHWARCCRPARGRSRTASTSTTAGRASAPAMPSR